METRETKIIENSFIPQVIQNLFYLPWQLILQTRFPSHLDESTIEAGVQLKQLCYRNSATVAAFDYLKDPGLKLTSPHPLPGMPGAGGGVTVHSLEILWNCCLKSLFSWETCHCLDQTACLPGGSGKKGWPRRHIEFLCEGHQSSVFLLGPHSLGACSLGACLDKPDSVFRKNGESSAWMRQVVTHPAHRQ